MNTEEKPGDQSNSKTRSVEKTIIINAPVSEVWKALTEAEELTRWFPLQAEVNPGSGGKMRLSWDNLYIWEFNIESWEEEKYLRCTYQQDQDYNASNAYENDSDHPVLNSSQQLAIDYFLETRKGKTVLRLVHNGFGADENWDEMFDGVRRGWNQELRSLKFYLENHRGKDRSVAWTISNPNMAVEKIWGRFMSPEGLLKSGSIENLQEGDRYKFETLEGQIYEGEILYYNPPWDFFGTVQNLGNTTIRVKLEKFSGKTEADIWFGGYDLTDNQISNLKTYWDKKFEILFPKG